jgi:hypothetical protein
VPNPTELGAIAWQRDTFAKLDLSPMQRTKVHAALTLGTDPKVWLLPSNWPRCRRLPRPASKAASRQARTCRSSAPKVSPSGSITTCFGPASTLPATSAGTPAAAAIATARAASAAATNSAKPAPMFRLP